MICVDFAHIADIFKFSNSWGTSFGDKGYFYINGIIFSLYPKFMAFYDIYWTINDLTDYEINYFYSNYK